MTQNITHHIPASILAAYAAGHLNEAFSLVVACHVSLCDHCRAEMLAQEAIGGAVLEDQPEIKIAPDALEAVLARIDAAPVEPRAEQRRVADPGGVFPEPLRPYAGVSPDDMSWKRIGAGVRQKILPCKGPETVRLLHIPAGAAVPHHSHHGIELTLVLQGAFSDEVARFGPGDVEVGDADLLHQPVAEDGMDCICLAATEGSLKFKSMIPRLFQPFIRI